MSEPTEQYSELVETEHDSDDPQHLWDCDDCAYEAMRSDLYPPDIGRVYDDHELGYGDRWLPYMTIDQVREELGPDGFSVIWSNVTHR